MNDQSFPDSKLIGIEQLKMDTDIPAEIRVEDSPLNEFSGCHDGIVSNFQQLLTLTALLKEKPDDPQIKIISGQLLTFFEEVVLLHHSEEEEELFVAVMDSASKGGEAKLAREYIKRLIEEHRDLEKLWETIEPDIKKLASGKTADIDIPIAEKLATQYLAHAAFEEHFFLPLSAKILSKNEMSALGMSLHIRHQNMTVSGYI
jgi:hemerythrin-like domain-containing protein